MRKWFLILVVGALFALPPFVSAQNDMTLSDVNIQLWPEYDRSDMLVINYITLSSETSLPAVVNLRIPAEVRTPLVVAIGPSPDLVTDQGVQFTTKVDGDRLVVSIQSTGTAIQLEYYDPDLKKDGNSRSYLYEWISDYDVQNFSVTVQQPFDAANLKSSPALQDNGIHEDQLQYYTSEIGAIAAGKIFSLELSYDKPSDSLTISRLQIAPVDVSENTPGRVSLSNSLPYMIGGLGVILIIVGLVYYWQSGRSYTGKARHRAHTPAESEESGEDAYCAQCGTRAKAGDRFCRVCGARLRHPEGSVI